MKNLSIAALAANSHRKKIVSVIAAAAMVLSLAACGKSAATTAPQTEAPAAEVTTTEAPAAETAGEPAEGGEFVFGLPTELDNFDPFTATTADAKAVYFNIYEGLVKVAPDGGFNPAVAESYEVTEDAKTYTFKLRDGVKFHNGNDVTTDDVLYSIKLAVDAGTTGYDNIASYEATDDKTVVITLAEGDADFIAKASQAIVPKDSDNNGELALAPIGTGPYKFDEYAVQDHVSLVKNEDYWGEKAHLDKVTVKFIASSAELPINYQSGAIDGFMGNGSLIEQVDKATSVINVANSNAVQLLALNNKVAPFDDVRVRKALSYAVNSDEVIEAAAYGYGVKIGSALIPGLGKYYDDSLTDVYDVNIDEAKKLLAEAGFENGFTFTVKVPSVYQVHIDTAQVIVNQLAAVGVTMNIEQVDWATWLENVYTNRDYEATIISVDGAIASPTAFLSRYVSDAHNNFVNFASDEYDAAYKEATESIDDATRIAAFKKCQQVISEEAGSVYIEDISNVVIYGTKFGGFRGYPLYAVDFSAIYSVQ